MNIFRLSWIQNIYNRVMNQTANEQMQSLSMKEDCMLTYFEQVVKENPDNTYLLYSDPSKNIRIEHRV